MEVATITFFLFFKSQNKNKRSEEAPEVSPSDEVDVVSVEVARVVVDRVVVALVDTRSKSVFQSVHRVLVVHVCSVPKHPTATAVGHVDGASSHKR